MNIHTRTQIKLADVDIIPTRNYSREGEFWLGVVDKDGLALVWNLVGNGWDTAKEAVILTPLAEKDTELAEAGRSECLKALKTITFTIPEQYRGMFSDVAPEGKVTVTDTEAREAYLATYGATRKGKTRLDTVAGFCRLTTGIVYANALLKKAGREPITTVDGVIMVFETEIARIHKCVYENVNKADGVREVTARSILGYAVKLYTMGEAAERFIKEAGFTVRWQSQLAAQYALTITGLGIFDEHKSLMANQEVIPSSNWKENFIRHVVGEEWLEKHKDEKRLDYSSFFARVSGAEKKEAIARAVAFMSDPQPILDALARPKSASRGDILPLTATHPCQMVRYILLAVADNALDRLKRFTESEIAKKIDEAAGINQ